MTGKECMILLSSVGCFQWEYTGGNERDMYEDVQKERACMSLKTRLGGLRAQKKGCPEGILL